MSKYLECSEEIPIEFLKEPEPVATKTLTGIRQKNTVSA